MARRVNEHKAQYERLQKAWREANLQACSLCTLWHTSAYRAW